VSEDLLYGAEASKLHLADVCGWYHSAMQWLCSWAQCIQCGIVENASCTAQV